MNRKILVVDDDAAVREGLRDLLISENYTVVTASDGGEALEVAQRTSPHAVIVDIGMPNRNGWLTIADLRETYPEIPVLLITARPHQKKVAAAAGVDLMDKPLDLPLFLGRVRELVGCREFGSS